MGNFLGSFGIVFEFFLTGNSVEFRLLYCKRADTPDVRKVSSLREAFREKQVESFVAA